MSRMVRKQVYIEPEQDEILKQRASRLGVTESELIRQGIDLVTRRRQVLAHDEADWHEALEFMYERARLEVRPGSRAWTREEIYDERLSRSGRAR